MKSLNLQIITLCILGMFINILYSQSKVNGVKPGVNPLHRLFGANPGEYDRAIPASKAEWEERFTHQLHNGKSQLIHNNHLLNGTEGAYEFEGTKFAKQRVEKLHKTYSTSFVDSAIAEDADGSKRKYAYTFDTNRNMTSELFQMWVGSQWVNDWQYTYTYDTNGNMISDLTQDWDGSQWVDSWQWTFTYDKAGNEISHLYQIWDGSQWINCYQSTYKYDTNGNWISWLYQKWDGSQWVDSWQGRYTYDTDGNMISHLYQDWDGSQWVNDWQGRYTYDTDGNMIFRLYQDWDGSQWVNYWQNTFTYDTNGNMISGSFQYWDGSQLVDSWQYTYAYDTNGNIISVLSQKLLDSSHFIDKHQYIYTYDTDGNLISQLFKSWNGSQWRNRHQYTYTYNIFAKVLVTPYDLILYGNFTSYLHQVWDGSQWAMGNHEGLSFQDSYGNYFYFYGAKSTVYYNTTTGIKENDNIISGFSLSQNHPNPFNPVTTINYSLPKNSNVKLEVFDVTGRKVQTLVYENKPTGEHKAVFNAANYSSGTYFYRLQTKEFRITKSMLLLK